MMGVRGAWAVAVVILGIVALPVCAEEPTSFADRFLYGGEVVFNASPKDPGYFNETDYRHNLLRLLRMNIALEFRAHDKIAVLTEIRSDNFDAPEPYALYVRLRPWAERDLDFQIGRIPPVFGAFARRRYNLDNPLIGSPLAYQYPTTIRADAAPEILEQVLAFRGHNVKASYPIGNPSVMAGLPLVNPLKWDTGIQARLGRDPWQLAVAVTQGTIANPRVRDDNSGKQLAGRFGWRPAFGWTLGTSFARGEYVADEVHAAVDAELDAGRQTSWGIDTEYSVGHVVLRAEAIWSRFEMPTLDSGALGAFGGLIEARYKLSPGLYLAARMDHMRHDRVEATGGAIRWEAQITRIEAGIGYYLHRHVLAKASFQYNERGGGHVTSRGLPAVQLLFWF